MRNLPFTLRQLEVLDCLGESGSFRGTADRLGISQPSVSNQIKELEMQLGFPLVARSRGRRASLTPEGHAFTSDLRQFWIAAEKLASYRRETPSMDQVVRFRVLVGQGLMDKYVRPKLDDFLYRNSNLECEFDTRLPHGSAALKKLEEDRFDCALLHVTEGATIGSKLKLLARVEGGIYGHRKFLGGQAPPLSPAAVNELPFILPPVGSEQERSTLAAFAEAGIRPSRVVSRTQYYDVIASSIERGLGVASLTDAMIKPEARGDIVLLHPLAGWLLVWFRKSAAKDTRLDALEAFVTSAVLEDPDYPALQLRSSSGGLDDAK